MYDFPELGEAHDEFWDAVSGRLRAAGLKGTPRTLTRDVRPAEVWADPSLLFAQGCEYPLAKSFAGRVRVVAHPVYSAVGCEGTRYRSAIVVRRGRGPQAGGFPRSGVGGGQLALAELQGQRCVVNELDSNSGMNLLRAAIAPLSNGEPFFASVVVSGSHLHSVEMVVSGQADVASIDCVSFAHFQQLYPALAGELRVLGWTAATPSLPYITARSTSDSTVEALRAALADVCADENLAPVRAKLLLHGVDLDPVDGFGEVLALERRAVLAGYPILR
ncbi:MAG: PhnD/SsuA/transferrin family substrate-binding protein [Proteobacteria bacterium]|nr:PhnD/SsuA/transferrin family substrate-binding protein [Pseudomonadota bacterium]